MLCRMPGDLREELSKMLLWFKSNLEQAGQWGALYGKVPLEVQSRLQNEFGLSP